MYRVLVWGTGRIYESITLHLNYFEQIQQIKVIGITGADTGYTKLDGHPFIRKQEVNDEMIDYIIIASNALEEIQGEIKDLGIAREKILDYRMFSIYKFDFEKYIKLKESNLSIIAYNCWGSMTYYYFGLPFLSPFINMSVGEADMIKLLNNLKGYLQMPLKLERYIEDKDRNITWPVCTLGDIHLYMSHYKSFECALEKWESRKKRINFNNLFIMLYTEKESIAEQFENLPYEKKVCFVPFKSDLKCTVTIDRSKSDEFRNKEAWEIIINSASGYYKVYDPWKLLDGIPNYDRIQQ